MKVRSYYKYQLLLLLLFYSICGGGQNRVDGFKVPRVSPLPFAVKGVQQAQLSLNGKWDFQVLGHAAKHSINVPGEWEMQGFTVNEGETAVYSLKLDIPADWKGQRIKIRFDGVSSHALVKVNNIRVGEHEGSFVCFEADITNALKSSDNILQVEVQALTISDHLACTSQYAVHTVGGLLRKVVLFAVPETNIASNVATTVFDPQFKNADLKLQSQLANESLSEVPSQLQYILTDAAGKVVFEKLSALEKNISPNGLRDINTTIRVKQPEQWNPEHPYLYHLKSSLLLDGKIVQSITQNVGFKQVEVKDNQLFVNGKSVKLHGVNRHSIYPLTGRSVSPELDRKDAELFRSANCNYIRTSHYPPSEEFLNAADELGLFVESEASLCWINHGASPIWKKWDYKDERFLPYMVNADVENVLVGRNHPSVIIWSLGNESVWSPLWAKVNKVVKQLDPSRPTTFHDQCWGGYNNAHSKADIAVYHYPGTNGPTACDTMKRPVLFGEYAHISCYSRRELLTDPGVRSSYGKPLETMYDSMYYHKGCLGGAIWAGIDDIFHMPDGRIVGYGPWGVIDAWRRPKPEYWGVKKAYSPIKIKSIKFPTAGKQYVELLVENRYDFTPLKGAAITVVLNGQPQTVKADVLPRSSGIIKIPATDFKTLQLTFKDPRGFIADEEKYEAEAHSTEIADQNVAVSFTENEAAYFVKKGNIQYSISKNSGIITSVRKGDTEILSQGPVFSMVPMNDDDGGKPNVAGETYQNNIYPLKNYPLYTLFARDLVAQKIDSGLKFSMNIAYADCKGKQIYLFTNDGKLIIEYEVQYSNADISPYQYGLMLQLPKSFDQLSWKRKGEFTAYPANDIARPEGTATLNAKHVPSVEEWGVVPTGDWKDDANDLGSNDFRATKRYIQNASLQDHNGDSVTILSDATQASRSWLQDEHMNWLIADYCNNGSEPFYGSPHSNGRIKIKDNTLKGKLVIVVK
ncbi:Beta galactosidase small chain [Mucilaginibacter mallensis]|uniref:beta-galactosidase n=1 Tax=Mucilaginibacter mallensis TaxID=652787 RepID=A0A1H1T0W7_MUCMA|nr:glycoside hydrolase family 2 TIM barrel-domain containing protein [Mucilaginibacter mallensis]SDS53309.1 Beta galactosidase small chain [Mucilaginibacter mallensis]